MEQARQRRVQAERRLEETRRQVDAARRERLEELEEALAKQAEADAATDALARELEALEGQMARPGESPEARKRRLDAMASRLQTLAGTRDEAALEADLARALDARLQRLDGFTEISSEVEPVVSRSGLEVEVPVLRVGRVLAVAGGEGPEAVGFVNLEAEGTPRVAGLEPDDAAAAAFRAAARGDLSRVPVDVDGSLVRTLGTMRRTFAERLEAGGLFVWPIVFVGLLGLVLVSERVVSLGRERISPQRASRVLRAVREGRATAVQAGLTGKSAFERVAAVGLAARDRPAPERDAALETALLEEEPRLQRSISLIAACAAIAPLLGLLGTVTGMISTFEVITVHGTGNPKLLSGGISVALVTTQFGLIVAVPLLLAHAVLSRIVQRRGARLEALRSAFMEPGEGAEAAPSSEAPEPVADEPEARRPVAASGGGRA
ncbi:MAG TPA: MotA/TolQ/ExbB proton channel family protein [Sandaracinaceae bacterium LLY-WYZ-13_1]|nr:MotA/TolQ/ExbB proton channel family protein [Sandaracinaceae bacterium LLY-WYZ-13_1]